MGEIAVGAAVLAVYLLLGAVIWKIGARPAMEWFVKSLHRLWHGPKAEPLSFHDLKACENYQKIAASEEEIYGKIVDPATKRHLASCPLFFSYEAARRVLDSPQPRLSDPGRFERR